MANGHSSSFADAISAQWRRGCAFHLWRQGGAYGRRRRISNIICARDVGSMARLHGDRHLHTGVGYDLVSQSPNNSALSIP